MNAMIPLIEHNTSAVLAQEAGFLPMRMVEIELGHPLPGLVAYDEKTGQRYRRALCLVRLHTQPLGLLELQLDENGASASEYVSHIWHALGEKINEHLRQDGLPAAPGLDVAGLPAISTPHCIDARERFIAQAPFVSIIISTRDRPWHLERCLHSLLSLCYPRYEVIIVDNAPGTSATADFIQRNYHDEPRVHYTREDRPGASLARNRGIQAAKGEMLAFTDDDVVVDPYWLVELVRAFDIAHDVACVTGLVLPKELETPAQLWFEEYGGFSKGFTPRIFDMQQYHPRTPLHPFTTGQFGSGVSMAFTAAFLDSVKGFDPVLGPGLPAQAGEDLTLFLQVMTQGHKLVYAPASLLYHLHRRDYASLRLQMYNYGIGLSAYLLRNLLYNPRLLFDFATKLPYGLSFTLSKRSPKNSKKSTTYPRDLTMLELKGMLYGPFAYMRSLCQGRVFRRRLGAGKSAPAKGN
jgi:glycosyltransferase involved in cell wall biosynthesis